MSLCAFQEESLCLGKATQANRMRSTVDPNFCGEQVTKSKAGSGFSAAQDWSLCARQRSGCLDNL